MHTTYLLVSFVRIYNVIHREQQGTDVFEPLWPYGHGSSKASIQPGRYPCGPVV
jgi:hypothetical protein